MSTADPSAVPVKEYTDTTTWLEPHIAEEMSQLGRLMTGNGRNANLVLQIWRR